MGQKNSLTFYIIYASRPHIQFEIDFIPTLNSQQHVKYGSNLKNFFGGGGGVLGNRMLNPEVLKCHEDFITLEI